MANKLYEETSIQDIADAIREKNGTTNTYKVSEMASAIEEISGSENLVEFSQMNPVVAEYLTNVTYDSSDYTSSQIGYYRLRETDYQKDHPSTCKVTLKDVGDLKVVNENKTNNFKSIIGENEIANLTPNEVHPWCNIVDGNIKQCGTVKPTGQVRMIKLGNVRNVRDLGGWACDGGAVKYGKLFRGGAPYSNTDSMQISITDEEKEMCRNLLGIQHEIDFRGWGEYADSVDGTLTKSVFGDNVQYTNITIGAITSNYAILPKLDGEYVDEIKAILLSVFESVKYGRPTYIHCTYGADRTGVVAFILNGLLGVSQSDLDKDYELTSFYSSRPRTSSMYTNLIDYLRTCGGDTIRDNLVNWAVLLGIPIGDINEYRQNMIDGTPETVSANIDYSCVGISLTKTSGTLGIEGTTIITAIPLPSWTTDNIVWTVSDSSIATVTGSGTTATVKGVKAGSTKIVATCGNYSAEYTVTVESVLPSGYTQVAYIDHPSTSTSLSDNSYCDLGITGRTGLVIKGKSYLYDTATDGYLVASTNTSSQRFILGPLNYLGTSGTSSSGIACYKAELESTFEFCTVVGNSYMYNYMPTYTTTESTVTITNTTAFDNGVTLGLFCRNNNGTYQRFFNGRLYWLSIEENGVEIMHLLPCKRDSDGVIGLYDIVGEQFFASLNSSVPFSAPAVNYADQSSSDWLTDYRISTSGYSANAGTVVTNWIPCKVGDVIRIKGLEIDCTLATKGTSGLAEIVDSSFNRLGLLLFREDGSAHATLTITDDIYTYNCFTKNDTTTQSSTYASGAYMRFCANTPTEKVIITKNEEIV